MSYSVSRKYKDFESFGRYVGSDAGIKGVTRAMGVMRILEVLRVMCSGTGKNKIMWVMGVVRILKFWELCGFWDKNQESYVGYGGYADFESFKNNVGSGTGINRIK